MANGTAPEKNKLGEIAASLIPYGQQIYQGGKLLYNWLNPVQRTQSPAESAYRKILQKRATQGVYSPSQQNQMLQSTAQTTAQTASNALTKTEGRLTSAGIKNSGVLNQAEGRIQAERMRTIANQARAIAMSNAESKVRAQDKLGEIGFQDTERDYQDALARRTNATGGIDDIASTLVGNVQFNQLRKKHGDDLNTWPIADLYRLIS